MYMKKPHEVMRLNDDELDELRKNGQKIMSLSDDEAEQVQSLSPDERGEWMRKNRNRNKACPCGSGKKFKRCCW